MTTILITGAGGPAGKALIAQLHERVLGGEPAVLVGADMRELDDPRLSLSVVLPAATDPEFTVALRHVIGATRADLVIPTVSEELPIVAGLESVLTQDPLRHSARDPFTSARLAALPWTPPPVMISPPAATAIAGDKLHTMWALDAVGVAVPAFAPASAFAGTAEALEALNGPIVVKPRVSRGGRGVIVVEHPDELDWSTLPSGYLVQQFAPGTEYSPQVFRSWTRGSTDVVVLEKTELREGRIGNAESVRESAPGEADDIAYLAERTAETLGIVGAADLDVRRLDDGTPVVLEVNARFGACSASAPKILDLLLEEVFGPKPAIGAATAP